MALFHTLIGRIRVVAFHVTKGEFPMYIEASVVVVLLPYSQEDTYFANRIAFSVPSNMDCVAA